MHQKSYTDALQTKQNKNTTTEDKSKVNEKSVFNSQEDKRKQKLKKNNRTNTKKKMAGLNTNISTIMLNVNSLHHQFKREWQFMKIITQLDAV